MADRRRSQLLTTKEAAEFLRLKPHTLENMRSQGKGPIFMKLGGRVFYHRTDLKTWLKGRAPAVLVGREAVRVRPFLTMTIAVALIVAPAVARQPPLLLIWNASPSVPVGMYLVTQASPRVGDLVALRLPPVIAAFAARRGYLPTSAYLLKPIAAVAGDLVCRFGERVLVRGVLAGIAEDADADGNAMPTWQGCRVLQTGEVFVLADHPASFDSRYFGPLHTASIMGRAVLLWSHRPAV